MPYWIALVPMAAFVGIVGAVVSLMRGRRRSAIAWAALGIGSILYAITLYYTSL